MKYDAFTIGQVFESDSLIVTKADIMGFAEKFDPQYMHLDEEKAAEGIYNGIIASGIHTLGVSFKLWVELGVYGEDIVAGTGMDRMRFLRPVYPGDELRVVVEVINKKRVKKDAGIVTVLLSTYNAGNEKVFKGELSALIKR